MVGWQAEFLYRSGRKLTLVINEHQALQIKQQLSSNERADHYCFHGDDDGSLCWIQMFHVEEIAIRKLQK